RQDRSCSWKNTGPIRKRTACIRKLILHQNFRSREQVLETANYFGPLMEKSLGGITYDEAASLIPGREFPKQEAEQTRTELLFDTGKAEDPELEAYTGKELEAKLDHRENPGADGSGNRSLLTTGTGAARTASYRDIAVLLGLWRAGRKPLWISLWRRGFRLMLRHRPDIFPRRRFVPF
ncbi:MAG: hypothetical protein V8S96_03185, partial [Lachnospiraceae bacterium]